MAHLVRAGLSSATENIASVMIATPATSLFVRKNAKRPPRARCRRRTQSGGGGDGGCGSGGGSWGAWILRCHSCGVVGAVALPATSCCTSAVQLGNRLLAFLASALRSGASRSSVSTPVGGGWLRCSSKTRAPSVAPVKPALAPTKGRRLAISSHNKTAREYWSAARVNVAPWGCLGAACSANKNRCWPKPAPV